VNYSDDAIRRAYVAMVTERLNEDMPEGVHLELREVVDARRKRRPPFEHPLMREMARQVIHTSSAAEARDDPVVILISVEAWDLAVEHFGTTEHLCCYGIPVQPDLGLQGSAVICRWANGMVAKSR
jgi:hypothetical protein